MTSQNTSIYTPFSDGHTVRDIVEHTPALVNEAWCRTLLRHTLDSLEQQYASGAPHRAITPDTLVMLANGETLLLPAAEETPEAEQNLAADLRALALVVHYAITAELPPEGPLGPRLYDNYSDQLTRGLDSCLGPNKRLRPTTVEDMRTLLGIEAGTVKVLAPAPAPVEFVEPPAAVEPAPVTEPVTTAPLDPIVISPVAAAPRQEIADPVSPEPVSLREQAEAGMLRKPANRDPDAVQAPRNPEKVAPATASLHDTGPAPAAPRKPSAGIPPPALDGARADAGMQPAPRRNGSAQRWGMIAGAAIVVLAAGGALFSWMQQNDARDVVPLALPPAERAATGLDAGETVVAAPGATTAAAPGATTQPADGAPAAPGPAPATVPPAADAAPQTAGQSAASADEAIVNGTTYKLLIKPWGTVYVDGVDRGVSPPVKRLTLAPGQHTIRIVNPNFPDHVVTVDAGLRETATVQYDFRAQAR